MVRILISLILFWSSSSAFAQGVHIESPANESLILANPILIRGTAQQGVVTVEVDGKELPKIPVVNGTWEARGVELKLGPNVVVAKQAPAKPHVILVTRGEGIKPGKPGQPQKVCFLWEGGLDDLIGEMAEITLNRRLVPVERTALNSGVVVGTIDVFCRAYKDFGIDLVERDGQDVHTILMTKTYAGDRVGQTDYDCGNVQRRQTSQVFVGTYLVNMALYLDHPDPFVGWQPMKKNDRLLTRIQDFSEILGRTAAHEFGHGLGLVGSGKDCGWMSGCDNFHNCDSFQFASIVRRFGGGKFIMDPGKKTPNWARMGEAKATMRSQTREPSVLNAFNRSYLAIVVPQ